jgi:hypothetical protein
MKLRITRVIARRSRWVIRIVQGRNERDPKGVNLFILALQSKKLKAVAFLGRGTSPSHQTYYDQSIGGCACLFRHSIEQIDKNVT